MQFELLTLSGVKFAGDVEQISLSTVEGDVGILPHHEAMTAITTPGPLTVRTKGKKSQVFATFGGLLDVSDNHVRLLADVAEHQDDLVASEVEAALKRAHEQKAAAKGKHELAIAQEMVDRHSVRLGVARMRRHHPRS